MLSKLLKYDLKWTLKNIFIFLGIGIFAGLCGRILELCFDSLFFNILVAILKGTGLSLCLSALVNCIIRPWVRFTINLYKDESYLTNTLPIKREVHYLSKILNAVICILISMIGLVINLFIMYYSKENMEWLKNSINYVSSSLNISFVSFIILTIILLIIEFIFIVMCGYFGIINGQSRNNKKVLYSFVYGFGAYIISSFISLGIFMICSLFSKDLYNIIFEANTVIKFEILKSLLIVSIILYTVYTTIIYLMSNKKYTSGIEIE